tara:strand:+ start:108 stop:452 length:345 start_codon:yes stop_codon:yes gene_type:complete
MPFIPDPDQAAADMLTAWAGEHQRRLDAMRQDFDAGRVFHGYITAAWLQAGRDYIAANGWRNAEIYIEQYQSRKDGTHHFYFGGKTRDQQFADTLIDLKPEIDALFAPLAVAAE